MKLSGLSDRVRKRREWLMVALAALVVYTLAGFFLAPWVAKRQIVRVVHDTLGLEASLERLRINPYTFKVRAEGFLVVEADGDELLRFDALVVNFQLSSIFRWARTFKEIRLVNPRIEAIVHPDGGLNLMALAPKPTPEHEAEAPDEEGGIPRLLVHTFEPVSAARGSRTAPARPRSSPRSVRSASR